MKNCEKCGKNEFSVTDEVTHDARFNDAGELEIGQETDNHLSEIRCAGCGHAVDPNVIEVCW